MRMKCECGNQMKPRAAFEKRMFGLLVRKIQWQCPCGKQKTERTGAPAAAMDIPRGSDIAGTATNPYAAQIARD
jgi:hypothetical protein